MTELIFLTNRSANRKVRIHDEMINTCNSRDTCSLRSSITFWSFEFVAFNSCSWTVVVEQVVHDSTSFRSDRDVVLWLRLVFSLFFVTSIELETRRFSHSNSEETLSSDPCRSSHRVSSVVIVSNKLKKKLKSKSRYSWELSELD